MSGANNTPRNVHPWHSPTRIANPNWKPNMLKPIAGIFVFVAAAIAPSFRAIHPDFDLCCVPAHEEVPTGCDIQCTSSPISCSGQDVTLAVPGACNTRPESQCSPSGSAQITTHLVNCKKVPCTDTTQFKCEWEMGRESEFPWVATCSGSICPK